MTAPKTSHETERVVTNLRDSVSGPSLHSGPETMLTAMAESQRELIDFFKMRVEKDGDTVRKAIGCRSLTDAFEVQSRWAQEMIQDYSTEMTRMLSIYTGHAAEGAQDKGRHG